MPLLHLRTNATLDDGQQDSLLANCSSAVSQALGKSEQYVMVSLEAGAAMSFAGSQEPCAYLELKSIGLPEGETATLSALLCDLVERELAIPAQRIYIEFANAERSLWGWNRKTF